MRRKKNVWSNAKEVICLGNDLSSLLMIKDEVCWWAVMREMWAWSYDYAYCWSGMPPQDWEQKSVDGYLKHFPTTHTNLSPPPMAGLAWRCKGSSSSWDFAGRLLRPCNNSIKEPEHCVKALIAALAYMRCCIWKRERLKFVEFQMPCVPSTHHWPFWGERVFLFKE